jgi:hypothetical protein
MAEQAKNDRAPEQRARRAQSTSLLKLTAWRSWCCQITTANVDFLHRHSRIMRIVPEVLATGSEVALIHHSESTIFRCC